MLISPAHAQSAGGGGSGLEAMLPLVLIFIVFYFLLIRPQQKKMKDHKAMLGNIRRGDTVITGGGITGKVTKVDNELEVTVEIAKDVKVKVQRSLISGVQVKGDPVKDGSATNENSDQKPVAGGLGKLFGLGSRNQHAGGRDQSSSSGDTAINAEGTDPSGLAGGDVKTNGDDSKKQ